MTNNDHSIHNTNVRFATGRYEVRENPKGGWMVYDTATNKIEEEFDFKFSAQNLTDILNTQNHD